MDSVQKQVIVLTGKVDALYQMIEQLNGKVSQALSEFNTVSNSSETSAPYTIRSSHRYASMGHSNLDTAMEHKDVLTDAGSLESNYQSGERQLSPEIQIQRLTAQLTAAYNRIAALEEQLFAQRVH